MISRRNVLFGFAGAVAAVQLPTLALAKVDDGYFELTAGPSKRKLYRPDGAESDLWTYNGSAPGPEIRIKKGERVQVKFINNLEEPTSVHWHGIRIENAMDGVSGLTQEPVQPGDSFVYDFVAPDAGTYWYHAHNKSWNQVARGLYGPLIIDDVEPLFDAAHDLTLMIDDWRLAGEGTLDVASLGSLMDWSHGGRLGNWLTVNGEPVPKIRLNRNENYRLRLVNAANARVFEIDPNSFNARVLGYDGQLLAEPRTLNYAPLMIGPAQRVDLLVTPENDFTLDEISGDDPFSIIEFKVSGDGMPSANPIKLFPNSLPEPDLQNAKKFTLDMAGGAMGGFVEMVYNGKKLEGEAFRTTGQAWAFNGVANLAENPFFDVAAGETVIVETINNTGWVHAMHVHGHHFKILNRSGVEVDEDEMWRDTFLIGPEQTTQIAFVADNKGKWLLHCHMLEHAAAGMNTWFNVA
ncbi:multicopper oxidase family protein [Ahrensia marina]|uniref:Multicopper oxidase n=1 Tax=Ahrensia marina TaxID=1514904 RepID=A0A0M9GM19_9HYPH|nr:multicopper oxidase family protein [Ahrensia marina]KPB00639.1 multicopper oxidase [Ahrensia marina]